MGVGWSLSIDFGTSNTAAAVRHGDGEPEVVRLGDGLLIPSAVCLDDGELLVGAAAVRSAAFVQNGFEGAPKTRLDQDTITLDGVELAVVDVVAAVLREVLTTAKVRAHHEFDTVVLTHPEKWGQSRRDRLRAAALAAGIPDNVVQLLPEAQAAARHYTHHQAGLPVGARIGVFDFGAGTCDVAVLEQTPTGFVVLHSDADVALGGANFDAAIWNWLIEQYDDPTAIEGLETGARLTLGEAIRCAKEDLSSNPKARIAVQGAGFKQLIRAEYDELIAAEVARAIELTRRTLAFDGTDLRDVTLYLTGGSSHTPLIHTELAKLTTIGTLAADPKTVVVTGALRTPVAPTPEPTPTPEPSVSTSTVAKAPSSVVDRPEGVVTSERLGTTGEVIHPPKSESIAVRATQRTSPTRVRVTQSVVPFRGLRSPTHVAVDGAGTVYVLDKHSTRITYFAPSKVLSLTADGRQQTEVPLPRRVKPEKMAVDASGTVYVVHTQQPGTISGRIIAIEPGAARERVLPFPPLQPAGIAFNARSDMYVIDAFSDIYRLDYSSSTPVKNSAGPFTPGIPTALAVDSGGALWVAVYNEGYVLRFANASAAPTLRFNKFDKVRGVAVDRADNVYAVGTIGEVSEVQMLKPGSRAPTRLPLQGVGPSAWLQYIAAYEPGIVYVIDDHNRVLKLVHDA